MAEQLVIVQLAHGWSIFVRGQWRGRFDAQIDVVGAALSFIHELNGRGADTSLVVQDRFGELRAYDETFLCRQPVSAASSPPRGVTIN